MVKVYRTHDGADAEFKRSILEEAGFHPALLRLRQLRGINRFEYEPYVDGDALNFSEIKVMVPCREVDDSARLLRESTSPGESPGNQLKSERDI